MSEADDELAERGARDWAHSIQARFAELLSGGNARQNVSPADVVPREHLDRIRKTYGAGVDPKDLDQLFEGPLEKVSEYDRPEIRRAIERMADEVSSAMVSLGVLKDPRRLMISTLPSGCVNAFCCANTWDDTYHHVFVDTDLVIFCNSMSKIVATCLTRGNSLGDRLDIKSRRILRNARSKDVHFRAVDLVVNSVVLGLAGKSMAWMPDAAAVPVQMILGNSMQRFVVAHEISHLALGHLDTAAESVRVDAEHLPDTDAIIFSHQAEFEADILGAMVALQMNTESGAPNLLSSIGPYVFMKAIQLLEASQSIFGQNEGGIESTHPPATLRAQNLHEWLVGVAAEGRSKDVMKLLLSRLDQVFFWLGRAVLKELDKLKHQGLTPRKRQRLRLFEASAPPAILGVRPTSEQLRLSRQQFAARPLVHARD